MLAYKRLWKHSWFWRTAQQQKIDYLEEGDGELRAFEFKWKDRGRIKIPRSFREHYPGCSFEVITPDNMEDFLLP
jgi:hypothetical protein